MYYFIRCSELLPITGSQQGAWNDIGLVNAQDADAFMINHGVTQEEIEEFHRLSKKFQSKLRIKVNVCGVSIIDGFAPPESQDVNVEEEQDQGQGRTFHKIYSSLKFWNWPAFENFRSWIAERRSRTTTLAPIPVYIVNNPHSNPYNNIYQSRPSYVK